MKTNPNELISESVAITHQGDLIQSSYGLTKREYFAAMAFSSLCKGQLSGFAELNAKLSVEYADSLIAELNKDKSDEL